MHHDQRRALLPALLLSALLAVAGCDKMADTSRAVQEVGRTAFEDTKSSWRDFFTYHPTAPDPLPQTRYCYQMQSDVVCYDGEQTMLTSKLVGYQDGENISWVQPGGGSLGASGGEPVALRPITRRTSSTGRVQASNDVMGSGGYIDTSPVATGVVPSTAGQIDVSNLPPPVNKK